MKSAGSWTSETRPTPPSRQGKPGKLTAMGRDIISDTITPEMRVELLNRLYTLCLHGGNQSVPALALLMPYIFGRPRVTVELERVDLGEVITQEMRERLFNRLLDRVRARDRDATQQELINVEAKVLDAKKNGRRNGTPKRKAKAKKTRRKSDK